MSKRSSRSNISFLLALLLTIFISIFIVITVTKATIMNPNYLISKMESADFYQQSIVNLNKQIQQETQSTGFPLEMFENYIDEKSADKIMKSYIQTAFSTGNTKIDTSTFESSLSKDIDDYLESANIIINSEEKTAISTLKTNLIDYFKTYLTFPYLDLVINLINTYNAYYYIIAAVLVLLIIITGFILYRLYSHYRGRRRYFAYALTSSGLICLVLPGFIYFGDFVNKISLSPKYFYDFITSTINNYLIIYVIIGIIMIIAGNSIAYLKFKKGN